jgi:arylsulfatase
MTATVEIPDSGAEGVLLCQGTAAGGYSLFVQDGRLHYVHNYVGRSLHKVSTPEPVPAGSHELRFEFEPTGAPDMARGRGAPGRLQLYVDEQLVAEEQAAVTTPFVFNPGALTCGANPGSPVTRTTARRSDSPARCTRPWSTCPATSSPTPRARCAWLWHVSSPSTPAR